jgi:hypothetical protein
VIDADGALAAAPLAAFTILAGAGEHLGNGWERAPFPDDDGRGRVGLFDRERGAVRLLDPPVLDYTRSVVALDGTPTKRLWELALGTRVNHRRVLTDGERREYLRDGLNLNVVRTSEYVKPYHNPDHVDVNGDAALLDAVRDRHGEAPGVITSRTAFLEYDAAGIIDYDRETDTVRDGPVGPSRYFGNVLGSNDLADCRLGVVIGSNHYGDHYVQKWCAYAGAAVERGDGRGQGLTYGGVGDDVLRHMREHDTLQAAMRFGRDGNGAVVYVHTDTLPDWVPVAGEGRVVETWSEGMHDVVAAAADRGEWRTGEIAADPRVDVGERQVRNILTDLADRGVVTRTVEKRGYTWHDDGLHELNEHGDVSLAPVDLDDVDDETVAEITRSTSYTWQFRNPPGADGSDGPPPGDSEGTAPPGAATGGGPAANGPD